MTMKVRLTQNQCDIEYKNMIAILNHEGFRFSSSQLKEIKSVYTPTATINDINSLYDKLIGQILTK
jgi:hypothetical protein